MKTFRVILLGSAVWAMAACGSNGSATAYKGTVKIAVDLPLSGNELAGAQPVLDAIDLAVQDANNRVGDYTIEVDMLDDSVNGVHNADKGAMNMQTIAADPGYVAVIGPFNSGVALAEIPITNQAGLFQCSPANTSPALTKPDYGAGALHPAGNINYVRVATTDDLQGPVAADYMYNTLGAHSVYVIDDTEVYGTGIATAFTTQFMSDGGTVVGHDSANVDSANYTALLTAAAANHPEGIYFGGVTTTGGNQVLDAAVQAGMGGLPFGSGDGLIDGPGDASGSFLNLVGSEAKNNFATLAAISDYPEKASLDAEFNAAYGTEAVGYAPSGYACAQVVLDALARAGAQAPADRAALRAAVRSVGVDTTHTYTTVLGTLHFDANGDTSQKIISIYTVDLAAAGGKGDWIYKKQIDFGQ